MSNNYIKHAKREFEILGWPGDCEMQKMLCDHLVELLNIFAGHGHSGTSAPYCLNLFNKLARFEPIAPLTGEDDEWNEVGEGYYQNKRDSEVFKKDGEEPYWISGKIFRDQNGSCFTNRESFVTITFPWAKPKPEYVDVVVEEE